MKNRSFLSFAIVMCILLQMSVVRAGKITPGVNLVTDGIPPLSTDLIDQTRLYNDFRPTSFLDWHPLREEALVLSRPTDGQTPQIFYLSGAMQERRQLTHFNDRVSGASFQPSEGSYFVFSKDVDGTEQFQLFRFDLKTGEITQLTDGKSKNEFGVWSHRGDQLAYTSNRRNGKDADFYVMNPLDPKTDHLVAELAGGEGWSILDWSPDDSKLLAQEYKSISESYLWLIDLAKKREAVAYSERRSHKSGILPCKV